MVHLENVRFRSTRKDGYLTTSLMFGPTIIQAIRLKDKKPARGIARLMLTTWAEEVLLAAATKTERPRSR